MTGFKEPNWRSAASVSRQRRPGDARDAAADALPLTISTRAGSLWLHIAHGPADLPLHLEVTGNALLELAAASQQALAESQRAEGRELRARYRLRKAMVANDLGKGVGNG